ncbi:hypothetical protein sphantq_01887 [Sphingobium sp. AntQ-1]|nr:hypothetical protein sphantq_01887 [Sphingobium sp. AntQ-1]
MRGKDDKAGQMARMTKGRSMGMERPPAVPLRAGKAESSQLWRWASVLRSLRAPSIALPKQAR